MQAYNNLKRLLIIFFWIAVSIFDFYYFNSSGISVDKLYIPSCIIVLNLLFQIVSWHLINRRLSSFFIGFVVFYYIFHFGQIIITGIFPSYQLDYLNYVTAYMNNSLLGKTICICVTVINCFFIGGLLYNPKRLVTSFHNCTYKDTSKKIFIFLFIFRFLVDIIQFIAALSLGYYGAIAVTNQIPGVIAALANMWYAAIPLYYLSLKSSNKIKRCKIYCCLVISYLCLTMLTGNRGHQTVAIVSLMIVVLLTSDKVNIKQLIKYVAYSLGGLIFIDIIYSMRETSISEFISNMGSFSESTSNSNIILETIGTFGETIYTPYLVIEQYGENIRPFFGEAFIKSIVSIVPDFFQTFSTLNNEAIYAKVLDTESPIGGSFAGEMYYNFGHLYFIPSMLFGLCFGKLSNKITVLLANRRYIQAYLPIVIFSLSLWWIRDSVGNLTRQIIWMIILIYLFGGLKSVSCKSGN